MAKSKKTAAKTKTVGKMASARTRSAKAGSPPAEAAGSPQARRRRRSAHAAVSKGTTLFETDQGPRAAWPASPSKRKKR